MKKKISLHPAHPGGNISSTYNFEIEMDPEIFLRNAARDGFVFDKSNGRFFPWSQIGLIVVSN